MSNIETTNWNAISAIATFSAVLVALFIPFLQEILRSRKSIRIEVMTGGRFSEERQNDICIHNYSQIPVSICRLIICKADDEERELSRDIDLPCIVKPYSSEILKSTFISHKIRDIKSIYLLDSNGKKRYCTNRSLKYAKYVDENYIGRRITFENSGDVLDERKVKQRRTKGKNS